MCLVLVPVSEYATKSSTSPTSTDQILGLIDGNPKAKKKEMRDSISLGFFVFAAF